MPLVKGWDITLEIEDDTVRGHAACNSYDGSATITGTTFKTAGGSITEMGCPGEVGRSQDTYMASLLAADWISREDKILTLTGPDTELIFEKVPPPPSASLIDTVWKLETLIEGTGPSGIATEADPATLRLLSNGTLRGSTGCRALTGEWTEDGNEIRFTTFSADGSCSPSLARQDSHVVGVLGDGFRATIDGGQLTLIAGRGGQGLIYNTK